MKPILKSVVFVLVLALARAAYADLATSHVAARGVPAGAAPPAADARLVAPVLAPLLAAADPGLLPPVAAEPAPRAPAAGVGELPPAPDSAALCLSALAGFGVWQLGRSARKLHLGALPDWYHTDAVQVGHATPLDLEFSLSAMPACVFDAPVAAIEPPSRSAWLRNEPCKYVLSQTILLTADPRGPPVHS